MKRPVLPSFAAALLAAVATVTYSSAQVIYGDFTNSRVTYLQVTESGVDVPPVLFGTPTASSFPESTLAFYPNTHLVTDSSLPFDLKTKSSQLQLNMKAVPGQWFTGDALQLSTSGSYNLVAPFGPILQSQASASFTASYTLLVNEVDNNPFSSGAPWSDNVVITPSGASVVGPGGASVGSWNGSVVLDINTIKAHFGIGAANKVTGMLLQYSAQIAAESVYGQASVSLHELTVNNGIPEPSTYALLLMASAATLWHLRRRR